MASQNEKNPNRIIQVSIQVNILGVMRHTVRPWMLAPHKCSGARSGTEVQDPNTVRNSKLFIFCYCYVLSPRCAHGTNTYARNERYGCSIAHSEGNYLQTGASPWNWRRWCLSRAYNNYRLTQTSRHRYSPHISSHSTRRLGSPLQIY